MHTRHRDIPPAYTGTSTRMQVLPHRDVSSLEHHGDEHQHPLFPVDKRSVDAPSITPLRKCVYRYEDKYTTTRILQSDSLVFDSHFESGNLLSAYRVTSATASAESDRRRQQYDLYMHNDVHTKGYTQWFYFSVGNVRAGQEITFILRNFSKPDSMYNQGMRPLLYSTTSKVSNRKWIRCGTNIQYFECPPNIATEYSTIHYGNAPTPVAPEATSTKQNATSGNGKKKKKSKKEEAPQNGTYVSTASSNNANAYCLSFTHTFDRTGDVCYIAFSLPYTYTDLQKYLYNLSILTSMNNSKENVTGTMFRRRVLCRTIAGNACDMLTITAPSPDTETLLKRVGVVITARVHPGETVASWMMQGVIDFLVSDCEEARKLREMYVFRIIPMMNPDGVINGNYRCNLSGSDLNRKWHSPDPILHPTVYHVKEMIRRWKQVRTVGMVLDLHGHSRKQGIFAYGCIPDKRHMRPSSPMSMLVLSNAQKQMAQSGSMKELGNSVNSNSASRVNLRSASICASGTNSQNCSASTSPVPSASGAGVILNMNPSISNAFLMGSSTSSQDIMYAAGEIEKSVMAMCALPQGTCTAPNESDTKEIPLEVSLDQYDEENENVFCLLDIGEGSKVKSRSTSPSAEDNSANVLVNNISIPKLSCIDVVPLPPKGFFSLEGINAGATGDGGNVDTSATVNSTVAEPSESSGSCENSNRSVTITGPGSGTNSGNNSGRDDTTKVPGTSSSGVNSGGMVTSVSQLLALPGGNSAANIFAWNNMVSINSATIVDVREDLPPEGCIPPKRDIHAWRNRLFPRIMEVYSPMFSLEYCSLKMHKSKATTMRMVTFLELGVDCVYTIECSLAGKYPHHFTAQDLLKFGSELGLGLVEVYPSLTTSPISSSLNECSGTNEDSKESKRYVKGQRYGWGDNSFSICSTTLEGISAPEVEAPTGQFANEILKWRVHCDEYNIKSGFGASLLTPAATKELTCAVVEDGDSDDDKEYKDGGGGSDASESVTLGLVQSVSAPTSHKSNKDDALMGTSSKSSTSRRSNSKSSSNSNGTSNASEGMPPNPSRSGSIFKRKALPLSATAALSSGLGSIALDLPSASPSPAGNNIGNSGKEFGSSGSVSGKGGSGFLSSSKFIMSPTSASGGGIAGAGDAIAAGIAGLSLTGRNSSSLNPSGGAQSKGSSSTLRSSSGSTGANGSGTGSINMNLVAGVVRATGSAPSTSRLVSTCSTVKTSSSGMNKAGNGSSPGPWVVSCPLSPPNTDPSVSGNGLLAKQNVAKLSPPRERRTKESKSRSPSPGTEAEAGSSAFFIPNENTPSHSPVRSKSKPPTLSSFSDTSRVSKTPSGIMIIANAVHADIEKSKSEPCPNTKSKSSNSSDGDTNTNLVIEKEKPKEKEKDKDSVVFPPVDPEPVGPVVLKSSSAKVRKSKSSKELLSGETHEEDEEDEDTTGKAKKKIVKKKKKNTSGEAKEGKTGKTKKSSNTTKSTKTKKSVFDKQNATSNEALAADEDEECEMDNDPNMPEYQAEDVPFSTKPNQSGKFNPPVQPRCNQNPMHHSNYVEGLVPTGTSVTPGSSSPRQTKNKAQASGTKASIGLEVDHKLSSNLKIPMTMPGLTGLPVQGVSAVAPGSVMGTSSVACNIVLDHGDTNASLKSSTAMVGATKQEQLFVQGVSSPRGEENKSDRHVDAMPYIRDIGALADMPLNYAEYSKPENMSFEFNGQSRTTQSPPQTQPPMVIVMPASMSISGAPNVAQVRGPVHGSSVKDSNTGVTPYYHKKIVADESQALVKMTLEHLRSRIANRPSTKTKANTSEVVVPNINQKPASAIKGLSRDVGRSNASTTALSETQLGNIDLHGNKIAMPSGSSCSSPNPYPNPSKAAPAAPTEDTRMPAKVDAGTRLDQEAVRGVSQMKIEVRGKGGSIILADSTYNDNFSLVQNAASKGRVSGMEHASFAGSSKKGQGRVPSSDNLLLDDTSPNSAMNTVRGGQLNQARDQTSYFNHYSAAQGQDETHHTSVMTPTAISTVLKPTK